MAVFPGPSPDTVAQAFSDDAADEASPGASGQASVFASADRIDTTLTRVLVALGRLSDGALLDVPHGAPVWDDNAGEFSSKVSVDLPDIETDQGLMIDLAAKGTPLFMYTDEGGQPMTEVWRGAIKEVTQDSTRGSFTVTAYEVHQVMLDTQLDVNFKEGLSGQEIITKLADYGLVLGDVQGPIEKLPALVDRGKTLAQILQWVFDQTIIAGGGMWLARSHTGVLDVVPYASNDRMYWFQAGRNTVSSTLSESILGMITSATVLQQSDDKGRSPVVAQQDGMLDFGQGIQHIEYVDASEPTETAQLRAKAIIAKSGFPTYKRQATAPLVMAVRKGDQIHWRDKLTDDFVIVMGISKRISQGTMTMDLQVQADLDRQTANMVLEAAIQAVQPTATTKSGQPIDKGGHGVVMKHALAAAADGTPTGFTSTGTHGGNPAADIFCAPGTPVLAPENGNMQAIEDSEGGHAGILSNTPSGHAYYFAHCERPMMSGKVTRGQTIGFADNSGNAANTATHLHFAVASSPGVFGKLGGSGDIAGDSSYWEVG